MQTSLEKTYIYICYRDVESLYLYHVDICWYRFKIVKYIFLNMMIVTFQVIQVFLTPLRWVPGLAPIHDMPSTPSRLSLLLRDHADLIGIAQGAHLHGLLLKATLRCCMASRRINENHVGAPRPLFHTPRSHPSTHRPVSGCQRELGGNDPVAVSSCWDEHDLDIYRSRNAVESKHECGKCLRPKMFNMKGGTFPVQNMLLGCQFGIHLQFQLA